MIDLTKPIDVRNATIPEIEKWVSHAVEQFRAIGEEEAEINASLLTEEIEKIKEMVEDVDRGIRTFNELKELIRDTGS